MPGAVIVKANKTKEYDFICGTRPDDEVLYCNTKEAHIHMNGQEVVRFAVEVASNSIKELLEKHNLTSDDIDYIGQSKRPFRISYSFKLH